MKGLFTRLKTKIWLRRPEPAVVKQELSLAEILRYPREDNLLPVVSAEDLLEAQDHQIKVIQRQLGQAEGMYGLYVREMLVNYANFVQTLPASDGYHHSGLGGLFSHGLDVASRSLNYALDREFVHINRTQEKKKLEPRYKIAAFIGGLLHDIGKPATDLDVYSVGLAETHNWDPMSEDLYNWATNLGIDHYRIVWRPNRHKKHEVLSSTIAKDIIPESMRQWMTLYGMDVMVELYSALSDQESKLGTLAQVINSGDRSSTEADHNLDQGNLRGDLPLDRLLVDTIRQLVDSKTIEINTKDSLGVYDETGLYIEWPTKGSKIILSKLKSSGKDTMFPQTPEILADQMIDWLIIYGVAGESRYVMLPGDDRLMVKFKSPQLIVDGLEEFAEAPEVESAAVRIKTKNDSDDNDDRNLDEEESSSEEHEDLNGADDNDKGMQTLSAPRVSRSNLLESDDTVMIDTLPDSDEVANTATDTNTDDSTESKPSETVEKEQSSELETTIETNEKASDTLDGMTTDNTSASKTSSDSNDKNKNPKEDNSAVEQGAKNENVSKSADKPSVDEKGKSEQPSVPSKKKHSLVTVADAEETLQAHVSLLKKNHPNLIDRTSNGVIIQHPNAFAQEIITELEKVHSLPNNDLLETYSTLRLLQRNGTDKTFIHNRRGMECVVLSDEYAEYANSKTKAKEPPTSVKKPRPPNAKQTSAPEESNSTEASPKPIRGVKKKRASKKKSTKTATRTVEKTTTDSNLTTKTNNSNSTKFDTDEEELDALALIGEDNSPSNSDLLGVEDDYDDYQKADAEQPTKPKAKPLIANPEG